MNTYKKEGNALQEQFPFCYLMFNETKEIEMSFEFNGNSWSQHPEYDKGFAAGQQSKQTEIDELLKALEHVQKSCHKSISYEHDLFDKGWNHSSRQVIINIYKLTGVGENLINE